LILRGLIASVLLAMVMPAAALAQAPAPAAGTIAGEVVNATAKGSSTANVSVTLFSLADNTSVARGTAVTDASGRFAFENVSANLGAYAVAATFQNAHYFSDTQTYSQNGTGSRVVLRVYDSTTDDAAIKIVNSHTVMLVQDGSLLIQEVYVFANMSDRTYIGVSSGTAGQRTTLRFPLPAGASGLEVGGDIGPTGIVPAQDGFADTTPVQPGQLQGYYTYTLPLTRGPYTYARSVNYPTISYKILVQGKNVGISGDRLVSSGATSSGTAGGTDFSGATATDLPRGFVLSARISGMPGTSGVPAVMLLVIAAVAVTVVGLGLFVFVRRRKPAAELSPIRDEESLLAELADLDDGFENGRVPEADYQKKRDALKSELVELIDKSDRTKRG
jgi:5-hydroxyisourate hydrolase-like protein (transthyretin family)